MAIHVVVSVNLALNNAMQYMRSYIHRLQAEIVCCYRVASDKYRHKQAGLSWAELS